MTEQRSAADFLPRRLSLKAMREAVQSCRGCDLHLRATQAVFGEGRRTAKVVMVGEQPGDQEDRRGRPFVGPAGGLLDRALEEAGIDRSAVYLTNAVKHFKWRPRGKRRIHSKPSSRELAACRPWLDAELAVLKPALLVALGATAAKSLFGPDFKVTAERGRIFRPQLPALRELFHKQDGPWSVRCMATVHPSSVLRAPDDARRRAAYAEFVRDLKVLAKALPTP